MCYFICSTLSCANVYMGMEQLVVSLCSHSESMERNIIHLRREGLGVPMDKVFPHTSAIASMQIPLAASMHYKMNLTQVWVP